MNLGSFKKYSGYLDLSNPSDKNYIDDIVLLNKHQMIKINDVIQVFTTQAKHHEMITEKYALGFTFIINLKDETRKIIKFTCDTGWSSELEQKNKEEGEIFKIDKIDILVVHIGSIKKEESNYNTKKTLKENEAGDVLYKSHLGIIGCAAAIHFWGPEISLISEFGEELDAIRKAIAENIRERLKVKVIPTDLNFRIDIETLDIMCFKTRQFFPFDKIKIAHHNGELYTYNEEKLNAIERKDLISCLGDSIKVF